MKTINERIKEVIEKLNLTAYQFSKKMGNKRHDTLYNILNNYESKPSPKTLDKIKETFPEINYVWLLTGEGDMINSIENPIYKKEPFIENKNGNSFIELSNGQLLMTMPLIETEAQAGLLDNYSNIEYLSETTQHSIIVDKVFRGRYIAFRVKGDSMDDDSKNAIANNYIVATRELLRDHWASKIRYNDFPYWVVYTSESKYPLLKEIINHDVENGNITFHSLNNSPEYCDFTLNIDEINALFYVIDINRNINNKSY